MSDTPLVHLHFSRATAVVTLDSPANRSALSRRLVAELRAALLEAERQPECRVVVLRHTGGVFCSGADLDEAARDGMDQGAQDLLDLLRTVVGLAKPVVAVVAGHCRAGGVGLMGACDAVVASSEATFAFTEARIGLAPALISLTTRSRLSDRDAAWLYLSGQSFDGAEAARIGLVTAAVPPVSVDDHVETVVDSLLASSPQGLRETKRLLTADLLARMDDHGAALVEQSARLFASAEAREGMRAFKERRAPSWQEAEPSSDE